jgi:hypothetical protein
MRAAALLAPCILAFEPASAQQPVEQGTGGVPAEAPPDACCTVPALTAVEVEIVDPASSRTSKPGDLIAIQLSQPIVVQGHIVAAAGTRGVAEVIQASKARMLGKAGELTLAARFLEVDGTRIPLKRLAYGRSQGSDPAGAVTALGAAAAATMPVASTALIFISGGNIEIKSGAPATAVVAQDTLIKPAR